MFGLGKIYCSVPPQKSFLPSDMFPNSTVLFHTTLNSPTLLSAPRSTSRERCRSTSLKNFTRKCSKLTRSGCKNTPLSLPKRDGPNSRCALSRRFVPPFKVTRQIPLLPISCSILPTVTVVVPKICHPRHPFPTKITPRDF